MFTFEEFQRLNGGFIGDKYISKWLDSEMEKNYAIALQVEKNYYEKFGNAKNPKIGDIVEFTNGWHVYPHAKIAENIYFEGTDKVCICENGSSHTNGKSFSTSGGAWTSKLKSELQYVGEDENIVWTWGCNGAGAEQGIYLPLKVNKWIIPYNTKEVKRSTVRFKSNKPEGTDAVWIENSDSCTFHAMSFESLKAFEAWAKYVGYEFRIDKDAWGNDVAFSPQKIIQRCWTSDENKPKNGKPIKVLANGRIRNGIVVTEELCITNWWGNIYNPNKPDPKYGTPEYEEQMKDYWKYHNNPMGV